MSLNKNILAAGAFASLLALSACTVKEKETIIQKQAPENMLSSFSNGGDACAKASCITIKKDALGKIFLMMISGKTSGGTPQWYDLKPQVVSFERSGGRVALLAENYNSIYKEIRTVNLVQSFELLSETEDSITFDWGQGLKTLVQQRSYDVDGARGGNLMESALPSLPITDSYVRNIKFDEKNISLEQIAKIQAESANITSNKTLDIGVTEETLALDIQIRAYDLSKEFKPKEYDKSRRVGFFVTKVSKSSYSNDLTNLITKWDLSESKGPITVRISSAVPEDYKAAVVEGVLYWNKVFGRDVLKAETGVDPQVGPADRTITVRWIPWLDSGAAYAMGQSDPLTGETLRAQVFMPSVFALSVGSANLVRMNEGSPVVVAPGALACDLTQSLKQLQALSREASDSQRLRLAQDSVRATVAHEVGHALGLRHNFAGSFSAKVNADDIYKSSTSYLRNPGHEGLETSTSIMDYVTGIDEILLSAKIKNSPLAYDKMAMEWAYSDNDQALDEKVSLYCTDDDIALANANGMNAYGCERFDSGNNPALRKLRDTQLEKRDFVKVLFASIIGRLYPYDSTDRKNLDAVLNDTMKWGKLNVEGLKVISSIIMDTTKNGAPAPSYASLANVKGGRVLYSKFGMDPLLNKERAKNLEDMGGYGGMLNALLRDAEGSIDVNWMARQVDELRVSPYLASGKTLAGREYQLSPEEQTKLITFFAALQDLNKKAIFAGVIELLPKLDVAVKDNQGAVSKVTSLLGADLLTNEDADQLAGLYLDLSNLSDGETVVTIGQGKKIALPKQFFTANDRELFLNLLTSKGLRFNMTLKKAQVRESQYEKIDTLLGEVAAGLSLRNTPATEWAKLPEALAAKGLLDQAATAWLATEISVLQKLDTVL